MTPPSEQYISRLEKRGMWDSALNSYIIDCQIRVFSTYSYHSCSLCEETVFSHQNQVLRIKILYRDPASKDYSSKSFYVCADLKLCDTRRFKQAFKLK